MHDPLAEIAAQIADGDEVDWQQLAESTSEPATLANLKIVADLAKRLREIDELSLPERWGELHIRGRIDSGAYADVLLAHDAALDREVALKLFRQSDSATTERLLGEARLLAKIDHPNVVRVYGAASHDGIAGFWMERVRGASLHDIVADGRRLGGREAAGCALELARGLAAIHAAGVIHGDIKAANVLRDHDGRLRIADFGSGRELAGGSDARISGTPLYSAPEVLAGQAPSVAADLYSLAVLLFYLLTGDYPRRAETPAELVSRNPQNLRDERPDLDEGLLRIVEQCLAANPAERPASAGALATQIAAYLSADEVGATSTTQDAESPAGSKAQSVEPAIRIGRLRTVGVVALLAAAAVIGWQWLFPPDFVLELELRRLDDSGAGYTLADGSSIQPGDRLQLALQTDSPLYLYVLNESDDGRAFGLYPLASLDLDNPLESGSAQLPGNGWSWQVSEAAAVDTLHVIASRRPLPAVAQAYAALPMAETPGGFAPRGIGRVVRVPVDAPAGTANGVLAALKAAGGESQQQTGIVYRQFRLPHAANN